MSKTSSRPYRPSSLQEEGEEDYMEGLANLRKFERFGRLTLYLRKAATAFKMAADRIEYAEHLRGNTLEPYIQEDEEA